MENCAIALYMKEECCEEHLYCIDGNLTIEEIVNYVSDKVYSLEEIELCELKVETFGNTKVSKDEIYKYFSKYYI